MRRTSKRRAVAGETPEYDVTPLMNLMIVLVPVLMLSMTLTFTRVIDLDLPWSDSARAPGDSTAVQLEVRVDHDGFSVSDGQGALIREVPRTGRGYDYATLSLVMQQLKRELPDKRDVVLLLAPDVNYQTVVSVMDSVRAYRVRAAGKDVAMELFPVISLGDAPAATGNGLAAAGANPGDRS